MLSSEQILESERLTSQVGSRRATHFREEMSALEGRPVPPKPQRRLVGRTRTAKAKDEDGVTMRISFKKDPESGEEFIVQEIL